MSKQFILPLFGGGPSSSKYYTKDEVDALISDFITNTVDDLENYYLKTETYTQAEIQSLIGSVEHFIVVDTLPTTDIKTNVIYLLGPIGSGTDRYEEWIYSNSQWVKIGDTSIDLSNYYTKSETDSLLSTKEDAHSYTSLERMGNYLYKITFETLPEETDVNFPTVSGGGCTSFVRGGKLYRNLDFNYDETNEFQVVTKNFTGMALIPGIEDGDMADDMLAQLPYHVNDGVNNYGIMVSSHILFNDWDHTYTGSTKLSSIPFRILTNLESIEDIETLSSILADIEVNQYLVENDYLMQFLVSDGTTTYVITPGENGYEITEATANPKLTNFKWVSSTTVQRTDSDLQTRPTGIERWNMIETSSLEDLRFTVAYETTDRLSEFIGIDGTTKASTDAELEAIQAIAAAKYATRTRNGETWQTVHSVVYASDGIDHLSVQENWDKDYFFDKDTVYTAGANITIENNVISASDTTYTAGEGIEISDNVISATGGGGGNDWYGTQKEFDELEEYDPDTNYFISDRIEYSEIKGAPNMADYYRKAEVDAKDSVLDVKIAVLDGKITSKTELTYMTQEEFDDITPLEGKVYAIEGVTKTFTVTYADETTETFNVVVD